MKTSHRVTGRYYTTSQSDGASYQPFIPHPLPPNPPLNVKAFVGPLSEAYNALGRLEGMNALLPSIDLFIYMYVRKEAVLSSRIEGTQSSLSDLLLFENKQIPRVPVDDVAQVSNYVRAMSYGLEWVNDGNPITVRLIRNMHELLLDGTRGSSYYDGKFRDRQNWIGGAQPSTAVYVPPPPEEVPRLMADLERFMNHQTTDLPSLLIAALGHAQFEMIHPFLDGNGRIGRLLIPLLLCNDGVLSQPSLYLSLYFKKHRFEYCQLFNYVRTTGDWERWVRFFLEGVTMAASSATKLARKISYLLENDRSMIACLGRVRGSVEQVYEAFLRKPLVAAVTVTRETGISFPTAQKAIDTLVDLGIVTEVSGRQRDRLYSYAAYLELLERE